MFDVTINFWAVIVAVGLAMAVGSVWYGPLFGKAWQATLGLSDEQIKNGAAKAMGFMVILAFVQAYVLAHVVHYANPEGLVEGLQLGAIMWLGFVFATHLGRGMFEQTNVKLIMMYVGNQLVTLLAMATVLTLWR